MKSENIQSGNRHLESSLESANPSVGVYPNRHNIFNEKHPHQQQHHQQRGAVHNANILASNIAPSAHNGSYADGGWYDSAQDILHDPNKGQSLSPPVTTDTDDVKDITSSELLRDHHSNQAIEIEPSTKSSSIKLVEQFKLARTSYAVAATCWGGDRDSISSSDTSVFIDSSMIDSSVPQEQRVSKVKKCARALIVMSGLAAIVNIYNGDNAGNSGSHNIGMTMKTMEERRLTPDHILSVQASSHGIMEDYLDHTNSELYDQEAENLVFFQPQEDTASTANIDENLNPNNSNNNNAMSTTTNAMLNEIDPNLRGGQYSGKTTEQPSQSQQPPLPSSQKQRQMMQQEQKVIQNKMEMEELGLTRQKAFEEIANQGDNDDAITPTFSTTSEEQGQQATEEEETRPDVMVEQPPQVQHATEESNAVQEQEKAKISDNAEQRGATLPRVEPLYQQEETTAVELQDREEQAKQEEQLNQVGQQETLQQDQVEQRPPRQQFLQQEQTLPAMEQFPTQSEVGGVRQEVMSVLLQTKEYMAKQQDQLNQVTSAVEAEFQTQENQAKQQDLDQVEQPPLLQWPPQGEYVNLQEQLDQVEQQQQQQVDPAMELVAEVEMEAAPGQEASVAEVQAREEQAKQDMFQKNVQADYFPIEQLPLINEPQQELQPSPLEQEEEPPTMELPTQAEMEAARQIVTEEARRIAVQEEARQKITEEENLIVAREEARQTITEEDNLQKAASAKADSQKAQLQTLSERALAAVERGRTMLQVTTGTMVTDMGAEEEDLWSEFSELEQVISQE